MTEQVVWFGPNGRPEMNETALLPAVCLGAGAVLFAVRRLGDWVTGGYRLGVWASGRGVDNRRRNFTECWKLDTESGEWTPSLGVTKGPDSRRGVHFACR